jgi:transcriptional regulator with XRE-family HTH domain
VIDSNLAAWLGRVIATARQEHRWSQRELARRLGVSQSAAARLELGRLRWIDVDLATRALRELGIRPTADRQTLGLAGRREQADLLHATSLGTLARLLETNGWQPRLEVEIGSGRMRGWIDLLAFRDADRSLLLVEYKTQIRDAGGIQRTTSWYAREAEFAARRIGWRPRQAALALILLASAENDAAVIANRALLHGGFPGSTNDLSTWLQRPGPAPAPSMAMFDPRRRRSLSLIATRSEGRRSAPPYVDYADAVARISPGRRPRSRRPGRPPAS